MDLYTYLKALKIGRSGSLFEDLVAIKRKTGTFIKTEFAAIASFITKRAQKAIAVEVQLDPIQSGSGTPSPDNVRPISGHTEVVTERTGVNACPEQWESGIYNASTGAKQTNSDYIRSVDLFPIKPNTNYCYVKPSGYATRIHFYDSNGDYISSPDVIFTNHTYDVFTTPSDAYFMATHIKMTTYNNSVSINYPSTDHDYHAYDGHTYTTTLGRTVYGGTLDVVSGELNVTMGYIASYNGETIGEPWISDRDEYVAGTTPSIGAEVAYTLAEPQTYQLTPIEVSLLLGQNNVWSDGDVSVTYVG